MLVQQNKLIMNGKMNLVQGTGSILPFLSDEVLCNCSICLSHIIHFPCSVRAVSKDIYLLVTAEIWLQAEQRALITEEM